MRRALLGCLFAATAVPAHAQDARDAIAERDLRELSEMLPGIYTNEEQVYFQDNLELPEDQHADRVELVVVSDGEGVRSVLRYADGRTLESRHLFRVEDGAIRATTIVEGRTGCEQTIERTFETFRGDGCGGATTVDPLGIGLASGDVPLQLVRARPFNCWVSPRKDDGTYAFYNDQAIHDQGGRIWIEATDEHPRVGLKMRNVRWPSGNNRDSFVLYTYQGEDGDYSPSYVWAAPDADRIGINTRWLQASCTAGDATVEPSLNLRTGSGSGN